MPRPSELDPYDRYLRCELNLLRPISPGEAYRAQLNVDNVIQLECGVQLDLSSLDAATSPEDYGQRLGAMLFDQNGLGPAYQNALTAAEANNKGLRVLLRLDAPELEAIHWERIYQPRRDRWEQLTLSYDTMFSRFVVPQQHDKPFPVTQRPLKILAIIASPHNLETYSLAPIPLEERTALHKTFERYTEHTVTYLESSTSCPPTIRRLDQHLAEGYHIVHFLCHGALSQGGATLYLEDEAGAVQWVSADDLITAMKVQRPPVLCFFAACETARVSRHDAFIPLGPELLRGSRVQAVIAMADRVGVETARQFTDQFYAALLYCEAIDQAAREARFLVRDQWDWGVPVLFSRVSNNRLLFANPDRIRQKYFSQSARALEGTLVAYSLIAPTDKEKLTNTLERLIKELSKNYQLLVDFAEPFFELSQDPAVFPAQFEKLQRSFRRHYLREDWTKKKASCRKIGKLRDTILPGVKPPLLDQAMYEQLEQALNYLSMIDFDIIEDFRAYLVTMNEAMEAIAGPLRAGDVSEAIRHKREFDRQIEAGLKDSQEALDKLSDQITKIGQAHPSTALDGTN